MSLLSCHAALSPLSGTIAIPGDKSLSHRALMFAALAKGETTITGLLPSEDVLATRLALTSLGVAFRDNPDGTVFVNSLGYQQFQEPEDIWNMGNSGTSARLLMGMMCNLPFRVFMTGDASLRRRPMARVMQPLSQFGATITARQDKVLPLLIQGAARPVPITYTLPVPSAQVKSAILLAGLMCAGETTVIEPEPSRDHTERLLAYYQIPHRITQNPQGGKSITVTGFPEIHPRPLQVVADPSSAAFVMVAALLVPGSHVVMPKVGLNPLRTGLIDTLRDMGGDIQIHNQTVVSGEDVGDIVVRGSRLRGVTVPAERAPRMIDDYFIGGRSLCRRFNRHARPIRTSGERKQPPAGHSGWSFGGGRSGRQSRRHPDRLRTNTRSRRGHHRHPFRSSDGHELFYYGTTHTIPHYDSGLGIHQHQLPNLFSVYEIHRGNPDHNT
jgi:3-phosphoshikimate 1-carboxyvinyltransferase